MSLLFWRKPKSKPVKPEDGIPRKYSILFLPSTGKESEIYLPRVWGEFIYRSYKSYYSDTTNCQAHALECRTKEEAIAAIREHMRWQAPRTLPREEWAK